MYSDNPPSSQQAYSNIGQAICNCLSSLFFCCKKTESEESPYGRFIYDEALLYRNSSSHEPTTSDKSNDDSNYSPTDIMDP